MKGKLIAPLLFLSALYAAEEEPPKIGNFSLPTSQEPGPLVSFGENIIEKGNVQLFLFADGFYGKNNYLNDTVPEIVWGIRDNLALLIDFPFSPGNKEEQYHSSGLEDFTAQMEWAFYHTSTASSYTQATIVGGIGFPTGSGTKIPATGFGAVSFFFGPTLNYSTVNWMVFTSYEFILPTSHHKTKFGNQFFYQFGIERCIASPPGWIFALMLEFDGAYYWKDRLKGKIDPDSGGNVIYLTPSIWISSKRLTFQLGVGYPVVQHLFGEQPKKFVSYDLKIGVTI